MSGTRAATAEARDRAERCPCRGHDRLPALATSIVALDPARPQELTRVFAEPLACPKCHGVLALTSTVAERYGRCAARCSDAVWWHDGERLQLVTVTGRALLEYLGIE